MPGLLVRFGGPAGAGTSALAGAGCATRPLAVHVEHDEIRAPIVSGRPDPQADGRPPEAATTQ